MARRMRAKSSEGIIARSAADNILVSAFGDLVSQGEYSQRVILGDDRYVLVEPAWVLESITTDPVLSPDRYARDVFDCDDYVIYLKSKIGLFAQNSKAPAPFAVGYIFTTRHAFNFCIDPESALHVINTQSEDRATCSRSDQYQAFLRLGASNYIQSIYL